MSKFSKLKSVDPANPGEAAEEGTETGGKWAEFGATVLKGLEPIARSRQAGESKYPIDELEVGDTVTSVDEKFIRNVTVAARAYSKRLGANGGTAPKFVTRKKDGKYAIQRVS
jgi:hypothetical protein